MALPKIIDNSRKKLIDCLIEASRSHAELSIATGYWDLKGTQLLLPHISKYKKIRLLIGRELLIPRHNLSEIEVDFPDKDIFDDLALLKPESGLQQTVSGLKALIESGVLEIKVFKKTFLHAKCYIFGGFDSEEAVGIIGSSNFTENGLTHNFELNDCETEPRIVLYSPKKDNQEYGHLSWFEEAWNDEDCVDWSGEFLELIDTSLNGRLLFSPYEMYIKTLDMMYGDLLKNDKEVEPLHSKKLQAFQERNVQQILWRLEKNGVAMLADSVGLGKTVTAIGVIKQYTGKRIVVISPKSLVRHWDNEIAKERLLGIKVVSLQNKKEMEEEKTKDQYLPVSLFVIDESHNLRTHGNKRFDQIKDWIINNENADTLLLTATPINNSIDDLTNQILIGTRGEQDLLKVNIRNSEGIVQSRSFFDALVEIKKKINQNRAKGNDMKPIYEEARQIIDPILREFVIRNTRQSIEAELDEKGLEINGEFHKFPKIKVSNDSFSLATDEFSLQSPIMSIENSSVEVIQSTTDRLIHPLRQLEDSTEEIFDASSKSAIYQIYQYILALSFVPYRTLMYDNRFYGKTLEEFKNLQLRSETSKKLRSQMGLYGLLRITLLKRFESSSYALLTSIKRYKSRLDVFEKIFSHRKELLSLTDINEYLAEYPEEIDSNIDVSDEDFVENEKTRVSKDTHNLIAISEDIKHERDILKCIIEMVGSLNNDDMKVAAFIEKVEEVTKQDPTRKILIFSFFGDTISHLENKLHEHPIFTSDKSAFVSGSNRTDALLSADRFSPIARDTQDVIDKHGELTYLFSTDVLAEGQNLQDCGLIINYDLHWNPVRMIQRNGRINRIGSPHAEIEINNIVPHSELEQFLKLVSKLQDKISLIQTTIGSDASVLGEEINPIDYKGIYDLNSNLATDEYLRLEREADVFTDDQYMKDLKDFYESSTEQQKYLINKIPHGKWGVLDASKKPISPPTIVFSQVIFANDKHQFTFYRNNADGDSLGIMLTGEALQLLRSDDKNRYRDKITIDRQNLMHIASNMGKQITRYEMDAERLTPTQSSLMEEARIAKWTPEERQKLEQLLASRNVFQSRQARRLTREIRDVIKSGNLSKVVITLDKIKTLLPEEIKQQVIISSITPIFGYAKDNN